MVNQAFTTLALAGALEWAFTSEVHGQATRHEYSTLFAPSISEKEYVSTPSAINYELKLSGSEKATTTRNLETQPLSLRGDTELGECYEHLVMADATGDSYLSDEEYIEFIRLQSKGSIDVKGFGQMDYRLVTYFYHSELCCDHGIDLADSATLEGTVKYVCDSVMKRLTQLTPTPTPSPRTQSPSTASSLRRTIPDSIPSNPPTKKSSVQLTDQLSEQPSLQPSPQPITTPSLQPSSPPTNTPSSLPLRSQEAVVNSETEEEENEELEEEEHQEPPAVTRSIEPEESGIRFSILTAVVGVLGMVFVAIVIVLRKKRLQRKRPLDEQQTVAAEVSEEDTDFAESDEMQNDVKRTQLGEGDTEVNTTSWLQVKDPLGRTSFYNVKTGDFTWERPAGLTR